MAKQGYSLYSPTAWLKRSCTGGAGATAPSPGWRGHARGAGASCGGACPASRRSSTIDKLRSGQSMTITADRAPSRTAEEGGRRTPGTSATRRPERPEWTGHEGAAAQPAARGRGGRPGRVHALLARLDLSREAHLVICNGTLVPGDELLQRRRRGRGAPRHLRRRDVTVVVPREVPGLQGASGHRPPSSQRQLLRRAPRQAVPRPGGQGDRRLHTMFTPDDRVLVAVRGGKDSWPCGTC